jgi:ABC-type multidrug transport system fused ATPase/permease subunit
LRDCRQAVPRYLQLLVPETYLQSKSDILLLAVILQVTVVLLIQVRWFCSYLPKIRCGERIVIDFRSRLLRHLLALPLSFRHSRGSTDFSLRVSDDANALKSFAIDNSLFVISDAVKLAGMACVTFFIE